MKHLMILAAVCTAGILMTTGCCSMHGHKGKACSACATPAMKCDGSCCKDPATCTACCTNAAGCAKCCKK